MTPISGIQVQDLRFRYESDGFGLRIPELSVAPGEAVAYIGASGCGKTTLLHLLAGILEARGIAVDGVSLDGLSDAARRAFRAERIGLVFQDFGLLAHLTVRENILLPYYVHPGLTLDSAVSERLVALTKSLGVAAFLDRRPEHLSQGERQRVALCRALITKPRLVLADEPTGNLDPKNARTAVELMLAEARAVGATVVTVTHDHTLLDLFDRVIDGSEWTA